MASQPHPPHSRFAVFQIFGATSLKRRLIVLGCLLVGSFAEGLGFGTLLPLLSVAAGDGGGGNSTATRMITGVLTGLGLPLELGVLVLVIVVAMALRGGLTLYAMTQVGYAVAEVTTKIRLRLMRALLDARWGYFARQPVGRFAAAIGSESGRAGDAYSGTAQLIASMIQAAIYLVLALLVDWRLCVAALGVGMIVVLSLNRVARRARRAGRQQTMRTKALLIRLMDALTGIKPLKAMGRHRHFGEFFAKQARELNKSLRRQVFSREATRSLQDPILGILLAIGFYFARTFTTIGVPELIVMGLFVAKAVDGIGKVQRAYQTVYMSESAFWAIRETIAEAESEREAMSAGRPPKFDRACTLHGVSFAFGDKPVLRDVSLSVPAGRVTAITGSSGAGKTTIADLLLGLYRPDGGEVRIDDVALGEVDLAQWRHMVGYVPQEVLLFHDTVVANVTLGDPELGEADARAALQAAGAWEFVTHLPDGMRSIVGERGTMISGGQRQRIAIARALVHRPKLLILDEATSALDPSTEAAICENLRTLSHETGLTILAISHQPAWIEAADRVYRVARQEVTLVRDPVEALAS